MKHIMFVLLVIGGISATFNSCSKDPLDHISDEESRVYTTYKDTSAQFSTYTTFKVPDSVSVVVDGTQGSKALSTMDKAYITAVKKYMTAAGYTLVSGSATADLGVNVNKLINHSNVYVSYGSYWGGFGGFWDPGFYWGYPGYGYGYPAFAQSYIITDAGISVNIVDLKNATTNNNTIKPIWVGIINGYGVVNNSDSTVADPQVKALFDQSTYLKK